MDNFELTSQPTRHYQHYVWDSARWNGFETRHDDILVCTSYKAGTTWMQMICALLIFQRTEFDLPIAEISPWMDARTVSTKETHAIFEKQQHRRFIKTHTPLDGLPWLPEARYICVMRDPRDIFMSMLNHQDNFNPDANAIFAEEMRNAESPPDFPSDSNEYFRMWLTNGSFEWESDGMPFWSVFRHGYSFWQHRDEPNMQLIHYSNLKADLEGGMRQIAIFLGIEIAEEKWPALIAAAGFKSMKANADQVAPEAHLDMWKDNAQFFNKGTSGQWQEVLSQESLILFDEVAGQYPREYINWLLDGG